jgi:hypothetical protein
VARQEGQETLTLHATLLPFKSIVIQQLKKVVPFIIDNNKGREVFDPDFTDCFHS